MGETGLVTSASSFTIPEPFSLDEWLYFVLRSVTAVTEASYRFCQGRDATGENHHEEDSRLRTHRDSSDCRWASGASFQAPEMNHLEIFDAARDAVVSNIRKVGTVDCGLAARFYSRCILRSVVKGRPTRSPSGVPHGV
jgi:hypothetical protein